MYKLFMLLTIISLGLEGNGYKQNEVIVKLKHSDAIISGYEFRSTQFKLNPNLKIIKLRDETVKEAISKLNNNPQIVYAEPNFIYETSEKLIPNDPEYQKQWGPENIDSPLAWSITTGDKIIVAVIDTGIDYNHKDLKENIWTNEAEKNGQPGIDDDNNGYIDDIYGYDFANDDPDPMDDNSHGTHCAGIIGAKGSNSIGIAGTNWNVSLLPIKFIGKSGFGETAHAIQAIEYAVLNGAKIISNSWGSGEYSEALKEALTYAASKDIIIVNAAGNSTADNDKKPNYPSSFDIDGMIAVASSTEKNVLSNFSSYGLKTVHLAAPGSTILSTIPGDKYSIKSGTSMATPFVSGAVSLLWSFMPNLSSHEVKRRILDSTDKIKTLKRYISSAGRLNVYNAIKGIYPEKNWIELDPSLFDSIDLNLESPHPYPMSYNNKWEILHTGAKYIKVHFDYIDVEKNYDFIEIIGKDGEIIERITGNFEDYTSDIVEGDSFTIRLISDDIIAKKGFKIDKYEVVM